jgi:Uri superfamily endonuclease
MKGSYLLVARIGKDCRMRIGCLGKICFRRGYYCYVGSAFGPGGLESRVGRHRRTCKEKRGNLRWHIDYFLANPNVSLHKVMTTSRRIECRISKSVSSKSDGIVPGFGCSDCRCESHLYYFESPQRIKI